MTVFDALVLSTLAQRETRLSYRCVCGEIVYGDTGRGPATCATCALVREIDGSEADPTAVTFVWKFTDRRA